MEAMAEAYQSEEEQIKAFAQADINKDGKLSLLEYTTSMQDFLKSMGSDASAIAPKQIAESFSQFDADADGKVTQEEWLAAVRRNAATKAEL
jgi:Ca2+-binding EF-hand superfamily protein